MTLNLDDLGVVDTLLSLTCFLSGRQPFPQALLFPHTVKEPLNPFVLVSPIAPVPRPWVSLV